MAETAKPKNSITVDVILTVLFAFAAIASGWCSYQSSMWNGMVSQRAGESNRKEIESVERSIAANQKFAVEAALMIKYNEYMTEGKFSNAEFILQRSDSIFRNAIKDWMKLEPFINHSAPRTPFDMPSYKNNYEIQADSLRELSLSLRNESRFFGETSGKYLLLTVALSSVLFFGGMSGILRTNRAKKACLMISIVFLLIILVRIFTLPVA